MKISIVLMAAALTGMLGYVAYYGRRARRTRDLTVIAHHHAGTNCVMWLALILIVLIEIYIHQTPHARSPLFAVHLPLALCFASTFLMMRFRFTGLRYSAVHRALAYVCLGSYTGALLTGGIVLWHL